MTASKYVLFMYVIQLKNISDVVEGLSHNDSKGMYTDNIIIKIITSSVYVVLPRRGERRVMVG